MKRSISISPLERLRLVGIAEGISYVLLLFVAMPLKYLAGQPEAVQVVGWAHGVLFIAFVAAVGHVWLVERWSFGRVSWALIASLLPFGTFVLDAQLRRERQAASAAAA